VSETFLNRSVVRFFGYLGNIEEQCENTEIVVTNAVPGAALKFTVTVRKSDEAPVVVSSKFFIVN